MSFEFIIYILLMILSLNYIFFERKILSYIFIPAMILFLVVIRLSGFDVDIETYAYEMKSLTMNGIYYQREFIFWFGIKLLYYITNSEILTFILLDLFWIYILYKISKNLSFESNNEFTGSILLLLVITFPFVLGYENIYRQFYALIFCLWAYSIININYKKSIFIFFISVFIHNTAMILLPLFIAKKLFELPIKYRIFASVLVSFVFCFLFNIMVEYKSGHSTGINTSFLYILLYYLLFYILYIKFKFSFVTLFKKIPVLIPILIMSSSLITLKFDMLSERIGMYFLIFLCYDLIKYSSNIQSYYRRTTFRFLLIAILSIPVLLFSSTRSFLL
jgi:hypothetical protein